MLRFMIGLVATLALSAPALATEAGWAALREGGKVVLLRHAMATGTTDPANFDIANCATQRNLSERGKQQARRIGALFGARSAPVERILSSRYCRALDTASIAFRDTKAEPFEPLDLLPADSPDAATDLAAVMAEIEGFSGSGNMVLVTHLENIRELAGVSPREGEAVIVRPDGEKLHVLARIIFN